MLWKPENMKKHVVYKHEKLSHITAELKKKSDNKLRLFFWVWGGCSCAIHFRQEAAKGLLWVPASEGPFVHLYHKECDSSSKLPVLGKVLQWWPGIRLPGLALCTGYFLFFGSVPSWGGHSWGVFVGWGFGRGSFCEFYFGFWWIRKQGICQPVTQWYWNMMQTASVWSTEGAETFSEEVLKYQSLSSRRDLFVSKITL